LVVNNGNYDQLDAQNSKDNFPDGKYGKNTGGIIGLYEHEDNAQFTLEATAMPPSFNFNAEDGTVEISGEEGGTIEEVYEPFLIKEGFLKRTPRGREVTELAYSHLGRSMGSRYGNPLQADLFE
jgi:hypothetical protein